MGIFDIFRGGGQAADPQTRLATVAGLNDAESLAEYARRDDSPRVRLAAVRRITDDGILADIARDAAEIDVRLAAVERIASQRVLADIIRTRKNYELMGACFRRITDPEVLNAIANDDGYNPATRRMAVEQFADESFLDDVDAATTAAPATGTDDGRTDEAIAAILSTYGPLKIIRALGRFRGSPKALKGLGTIARDGGEVGGLAVEYLCRGLGSDNPALRDCAADQLAALRDAEMISVLVRSLDNPNLARPIREILHRIDTPQARAALGDKSDSQ